MTCSGSNSRVFIYILLLFLLGLHSIIDNRVGLLVGTVIFFFQLHGSLFLLLVIQPLQDWDHTRLEFLKKKNSYEKPLTRACIKIEWKATYFFQNFWTNNKVCFTTSTRASLHYFVILHSFVMGILKTQHSSTVLNLNIFSSISFWDFLKIGGWNERAQWELSDKPIKSDVKVKKMRFVLFAVTCISETYQSHIVIIGL